MKTGSLAVIALICGPVLMNAVMIAAALVLETEAKIKGQVLTHDIKRLNNIMTIISLVGLFIAWHAYKKNKEPVKKLEELCGAVDSVAKSLDVLSNALSANGNKVEYAEAKKLLNFYHYKYSHHAIQVIAKSLDKVYKKPIDHPLLPPIIKKRTNISGPVVTDMMGIFWFYFITIYLLSFMLYVMGTIKTATIISALTKLILVLIIITLIYYIIFFLFLR